MFTSTNILPANSDSFFWADFLELNAVLHQDKCLMRSDFDSMLSQNTDSTRSVNEERSIKWRETTGFIEGRAKSFARSYPFTLSETGNSIEFHGDKSNKLQLFYLFLLTASSMRFIKKTEQHKIARLFEETCCVVFAQLVPKGSEIRSTWAGGGAAACYQGTLYEKMREIAKDLRCRENFSSADFKENDTGDGGLDIIAWHSMEDDRDGMPISFAQCGCSKTDWEFKQLEASPAKHGHHFPVMHEWATYYFMPLDLRSVNGDWGRKSDIGRAIIVDRLRLTRIAERNALSDSLPDFELVESLMN